MTTPTITRLKLPAVRQYVESRAWAIHKEKGLALLEVLEVHAQGGGFTAEEIRARVTAAGTYGGRGNAKPITKTGGTIAVLPLYGVIAQRMDMMMEYCGGTSAERFADEFDAAMADPNVVAIVLDVDSPGGTVQGTPELAKRIYDARGKGKQLIAVSNGCMASAAYWIGSACDEVVASPSADTGSIGVYTVHVDASGYNEKLGLKYTLIKAGDHKAEDNPWEPLSEDAESFIQGQIDEMGTTFVAAVAKHRGKKASEINANFGQGRCFTAKQALAAGMVDRIATLEDVLGKLGAKDVGMSGRPRRAFGQAAAVMNDRGIVETPITLTARAEDTPDPETTPDHDMCPECGGALDDDGHCGTCGYTKSQTTDDTTDDEEDSPPSNDSARADGADATATHLPDNRPLVASEDSVSGTATAPSGAPNLDAQIKAERERASAIRKLGMKHRVTDERIEAMINEGLTIDQAATRILGDVEARGAASPTIRVGADREADRAFANAGEQLFAIMQQGRTGVRDPRLTRVNHNAMQIDRQGALDMMAGSPSGMNESVGSEGGFFIAPEVLPGVIEPVYTEDPILSRVTRIPIGSQTNRTVYNVVDESSRTDGNRWGGLQMYWGDEADSATAKKPKLRQVEQLLKKLIGLWYLTDELVQDAPASQALLQNAFETELRFMIANGVFRGKGGGQMVGFLTGKGGVSQAIEGTQTIANSNTFISKNVSNMLANIPAALWGDVIFLYNQELLTPLVNALIGTSSIPVFMGAGGLSGKPYDTILGRPAFASELCEAQGTVGDFIAIAPSQYHLAEKGGAQIATSIHVRFLNDELTMRITYRVDGKPVWNTTVTPFKGTAARGFFSTLAARS